MSESKIRGGAPSLSAADGTQMTADAWRPIETAPKDGTEVLTFRKAGLQAVAVNFGDGWVVADGAALIGVSHWMPLPAPPRSSEGHPTDEGRRAPPETLAEPDEAALERMAAAYEQAMIDENGAYARVWHVPTGIKAMRAALSSLTVTESGE